MDIKYDGLYFTLDDIAEQVQVMQQYATDEEVCFKDNEVVAAIGDSLEHRLAFHKTEYDTKFRSLKDRADLEKTHSVWVPYLAACAINSTFHALAESGDTGIAREQALEAFSKPTVKVARLTSEKRLENSRLEQAKQSLALDGRASFVLPRALSAIAGGAAGVMIATALKTGETLIPYLEMTPAKGGLIGMIAPAALYNARSILRGTSRHIGGVFKFWGEGSIRQYSIPESVARSEEGAISHDETLDYYAERDARVQIEGFSRSLGQYKFRTKEDIAPMIHQALEGDEERMLAGHGISRNRSKNAPLHRKVPSRITGLDFLG